MQTDSYRFMWQVCVALLKSRNPAFNVITILITNKLSALHICMQKILYTAQIHRH